MRKDLLCMGCLAAVLLAASGICVAAVDPAGLIGYWKFDDPVDSPIAADSSGNLYDGTVMDASAGANSFGLPGVAGTAWQTVADGQEPWSGTSDYIQLPPSNNDELRLGGTDLTMAGWIKWDDLSASQHPHLFYGFHNGVNAGWVVYGYSGVDEPFPATFGFSIREVGMEVIENLPDGAWNETDWYFFAARYRQEDGQAIAWVARDDQTWDQRSGAVTTLDTPPDIGSGDPKIGREGGAGAFSGQFDEFSMWMRALTNEEVQEVFEAGVAGTALSEILSGQQMVGDANGDGNVNDDDLSLLLANWDTNTDWAHGNFNGDNVVNDDDLSLLLANWTGGAAAGVPEPATLALLCLGGLAFLRRRA